MANIILDNEPHFTRLQVIGRTSQTQNLLECYQTPDATTPVFVVGPTGAPSLGSGGAVISGDGSGTITADSPNTGSALFRAGRGKPLGPPPGTITLATGGAGALTGVYQYVYTETAGTGESSLSATATYTASSEKIQVTVPLLRRGTSSRRLYRTAAGGSSFALVHDFGGGGGYFQTIFMDNVADGSRTTAAPTTDTSLLYELEINAGVSYARTHPDQLGAAGDLTVLKGDPATSGSYGMDCYGPILTRSALGNNFGSQKTGTSGTHFYAEYQTTTDDGSSPTNVFNLFSTGEMQLLPQTMIDGGQRPFALTATFPTTITANRFGASYSFTGAGSSNFEQQGLRIDFLAGYTGASSVRAIAVQQSSANSGVSYAIWASASGAAGKSFGVSGSAAGGTTNIGCFGGLGVDAASYSVSSGIAGSNGATTDDIARFYDNAAIVLQIRDGGALTFAAITNGSINTGDLWRDNTQKAFGTRLAGSNMFVPTMLATQTADKTVGNTVVETSLVGTLLGSATLAANFWSIGKTVRLRSKGYLSSTGTPNLTINVKLGTVSVVTTGAVAQVGTPTNVGWELDVSITARTIGVSGTVIAQGRFTYGATDMPLVSTATTTIDTTASNLLDFLATWSVAVGGNTLTSTNTSMEVLN